MFTKFTTQRVAEGWANIITVYFLNAFIMP